jgi:hypothetical protein
MRATTLLVVTSVSVAAESPEATTTTRADAAGTIASAAATNSEGTRNRCIEGIEAPNRVTCPEVAVRQS